jgi:caa(3)-type oxidase subunit IV
MAHVNRKEYFTIFIALAVLTALEVGIVYVPGIPTTSLVTALVALALTKAGAVGLFFMHLRHETKILRWSVAIPMATPMIYALVLVGEAGWRLL